jgi:hypothetical protein
VHAADFGERRAGYGGGLRTNADLDGGCDFYHTSLTGQKLFERLKLDAIVVAGLYAHLTRWMVQLANATDVGHSHC